MYYANVYESSTDRPRRQDLSAPTLSAAKLECEALSDALRAGDGALDLWCEGYEEFGREGRMVRTSEGIDWVN
jgi:hypothetical protein